MILWHSLLECLLVLVLLFGATTFVRWVVGPSPISSAIPTVRVRLIIIGAAVGVLLFGLILSPAWQGVRRPRQPRNYSHHVGVGQPFPARP